MKKSDYVKKEQNQKIAFDRAAKIDGKDQNLRVNLTLNSQKGLFTIDTKIGFNKICDDKTRDTALLQTLAELQYEAVKEGLEWRKNWLKGNKEEDNQKSLFDAGSKDDKKGIAKRAAKMRVEKKGK